MKTVKRIIILTLFVCALMLSALGLSSCFIIVREDPNERTIDGILYSYDVSNEYGGNCWYVSTLASNEFPENLVIEAQIDGLPVKAIRQGAFNGAGSGTIKSATIPSSVVYIGDMAFSIMHDIKRVDYNGTVADWGRINFESEYSNPIYEGGAELYVNGEKVTVVEVTAETNPFAFVGCSSLTEVIVKEGVTRMGLSCCANLEKITLPSSLTEMGSFYACNNLKDVYYAGTIDEWVKIDRHIDYDIDRENIFSFAENFYVNNSLVEEVEINVDVKANAFRGYEKLKGVTINGDVTIGDKAFRNCKIKEFSGAASYIPHFDTTELTDLNINGGTSLDNFNSKRSLKSATIKNVQIIKNSFDSCDNLEEVTVENVETIENSFGSCDNLKNVTIENVETIEGSFSACDNLKNVVIGTGIEYIKGFAFFMSDIESLTISEDIKGIEGTSAFNDCSNIKYLVAPDIVFSYANIGKSKLEEATILGANISRKTFVGATNLKKLTISETIKSVENAAFYYPFGCELEKVYYLGSLNDWLDIKFEYSDGNYSYTNPLEHAEEFYINDELVTDLVLTKDVGENAFRGYKALQNVTLEGSIGVGDSAFKGCTKIESISVGDSVKKIGKESFVNCFQTSLRVPYEWISYFNSLRVESLVLTSGDRIYKDDMQGFTSLTSLTMPNTIQSIESASFSSSVNLTKVNYLGTLDQWCQISFEDEYSNPISQAKNLYINGELVKNVEINTDIMPNAFYNCDSLESVKLGSSVKSVGNYGFAECSSLASVTFAEGLEKLGNGAFSNCSNVTSVVLPSTLTEIGTYTFNNCIRLETVVLPVGVTSIGQDAFIGCRALTKVLILGDVDIRESVAQAEGNEALFEATAYLYKEENPNKPGNYWYMESGVIGFYPLHVHTEEYVAKQNPDCYNVGYEEGYICSVCKEVISGREEIAASGHTPEVDEAVAPTCTKIGLTEGSHCKECGEVLVEQEEIPAQHTDIITDEAVAPTCTKTGLTEGSHCEDCGTVLKAQEEVPASHNFIRGKCYGCGEVEETSEEYLSFTLLADGTYSVKVKDPMSMPDHIKIPATYNGKAVTVIEEYAFAFIVSTDLGISLPAQSTLLSIKIPSSIKIIKANAFSGCNGLEKICIPASVEVIEDSAICVGKGTICCEVATKPEGWSDKWNQAQNIENGGAETAKYIPVIWNCNENNIGEDGYQYISVDGINYAIIDGNAQVVSTAAIGALVIPSAITYGGNSYNVTSIRTLALSYNPDLESVYIPNTVVEIEAGAFMMSAPVLYCEATSKPQTWTDEWNYYYGTEYLPVVWDCKNNTVASDGYVHVRVDGINYGLSGTKAVVVLTVARGDVVIPSSIAYGGITYNVEQIASGAFTANMYLDSITLSEGITTVNDFAFQFSNVKEVIIPKTVTKVGQLAFLSCFSPVTVKCEMTAKPSAWNMLWDMGSLKTVEVVWGYKG